MIDPAGNKPSLCILFPYPSNMQSRPIRFWPYLLIFLCFLPQLVSAQSPDYCQDDRFGRFDTLFDSEDIIIERDLIYGEAITWVDTLHVLKYDIYMPDPAIDPLALRPMLIYIHGGGFHGGSKSNEKGRLWGEDFARRGYVVASIDYRVGWTNSDSCQADTIEYKEAVYRAIQDCRAAFHHIQANAADWNADPDWMFILGASAGSGAAMFMTYYEEEDYPQHLIETLGPLDTTDASPIQTRGVITKAGSLGDLEPMAKNPGTPHLLFHGNCDLTVPYYRGPIFHCYAPDPFVWVNGSDPISQRLEELGSCYWLYKSLGNGHVAAANDTVTYLGADFLKSVLCDDCETKKIERLSGKNICKDRASELVDFGLLYPNPSNGRFRVLVESRLDGSEEVRLLNMFGEEVYSETLDYAAPVQALDLDFRDQSPGTYILQIGRILGQGRLVIIE